ncbi:MAG: hypothetical protein AVDCRST_MAG16-1977, partial [uncultured Frankineae bacterium]
LRRPGRRHAGDRPAVLVATAGGGGVTTPTAGDLRQIRMLQMPVQVWAAAQEHHDELMREFALLSAGQEEADVQAAPVPRRLMRLIHQLTTRFAGTADAQREQLFAAAAQGQEVIEELVYFLPPAAGPATVELARMLEEADEYCRSGQHLLTLQTPDEVRLFREWYLGQMREQIDGAAPVPWPDHLERARAGQG